MRQEAIVLAVLMLALTGCGWKERHLYKSPDGAAWVTISEPRGLSSGLQVVLHQNGHEYKVHEMRGDTFFYLAEVYWSPNGRLLGVFTCNSPLLKLAVDRRTLSPLPFSMVSEPIRKRIQQKYSPPRNWDEFDWACVNSGTEGFVQRFGDATRP